jgi:hypothetical protein
LFAAVTKAHGATESSAAREVILTTLGFSDPADLRRRIEAGENLCHNLWSLAHSLLANNVGFH